MRNLSMAHEPANAGEGMNMRAGFIRGRGKEPDQSDRPAVDGLKIDGGGKLFRWP